MRMLFWPRWQRAATESCLVCTGVQEVGRREQEITERRSALQEMKRKNELVQDKVVAALNWL